MFDMFGGGYGGGDPSSMMSSMSSSSSCIVLCAIMAIVVLPMLTKPADTIPPPPLTSAEQAAADENAKKKEAATSSLGDGIFTSQSVTLQKNNYRLSTNSSFVSNASRSVCDTSPVFGSGTITNSRSRFQIIRAGNMKGNTFYTISNEARRDEKLSGGSSCAKHYLIGKCSSSTSVSNSATFGDVRFGDDPAAGYFGYWFVAMNDTGLVIQNVGCSSAGRPSYMSLQGSEVKLTRLPETVFQNFNTA